MGAIVWLFISIVFESSFSDGKFIPSQLNVFMKGWIFGILCGFVFISSWFNATVTAYWEHLLSFSLIRFTVGYFFYIQSGESRYDPLSFGFILWYS